MAKFTANHSKLYFDTLCRTQKGESVLSLIHATYQAKKNGGDKVDIAKRLESAYKVFKNGAGTYTGELSQFESQYTIGHELCIWKNSSLDLTDLAIRVAENYITIRDYFDIVFLNYIQPVNGNIVHVLYHLLRYMTDNGKKCVTKDEMASVYMSVGNTDQRGEINGAYNMLIASSYFKPDESGRELNYIGKCSIEELMSRCNITYVQKGYAVALEELKDESAYIDYLLDDHRSLEITEDDETDYTEEQLSSELKELYGCYGTAGIHLFGIRRGKYIKAKGIRVPNLCKLANISDNYKQEIGKGVRLTKFVAEKSVYDQELQVADETLERDDKIFVKYSDFIEGGYNVIYYGTPGCGKSHYVENELLEGVSEEYKYRTTFYMDYTHTDFVGQLMPVVKKEQHSDGTASEVVSYKFIPGPFTLALKKAYTNPKEKIYLVIEEINRGNAASILGDLFQLLDREKEGNKKGMPVGQSEYKINKVDMYNYLVDEENIVLPEGKIFIPSNLCLIGTMNTNDQNVSTLDTAFKRRWKMRKINNDFTSEHPYSTKYVPGTRISWQVFVEKVNEKIVNDVTIGINAEDKQIGPFFMDAHELEVLPNQKNEPKQRDFAYKMLEYLWSNVAKYERESWFKGNPRTLDKLVDDYVSVGVDIFEGDIFGDESENDVQMHSDNGEEE